MVLILFQIKNQTWCIELEWVREVVNGGIDKPLPNARSMIEGMKNIRGEVIPVVNGTDLVNENHLDDLMDDEGTGGKILLIEYSGVSFGLSVNTVQGVENIPWPSVDQDNGEYACNGVRQEFVKTYIGSADNEKIPLLDIKRLSRLMTEREETEKQVG